MFPNPPATEAPADPPLRIRPVVGWLLVGLLGAGLWPGCGPGAGQSENATSESSSPRPPARPLEVLVVDDPLIGPVMSRQFSARKNSGLNVTDISWQELAGSQFDRLDQFDVVVYPARRIGELAAEDRLRTLEPEDLVASESRRSVLYFDRQSLPVWGEETLGVSLGQCIPVMLCRDDVLEATGCALPRTWEELDQLSEALNRLPDDSLPGEIGIPLQDHWASHMLLARAAPAVRSAGKYSALFDVSDLQPLIDRDPWLRALQGWARNLDPAATADSPDDVLQRFLDGQLAVALVPVHPQMVAGREPPEFGFQLAPLPGHPQTYDVSTETWGPKREGQARTVPLVGSNGMVASVVASSGRSRIAADLLAWLQDKQISSLLAQESANAGLSQKSHLADPVRWLGDPFSPEHGLAYGELLQAAHDQRLGMLALRIPGSDQYLDVLDQAIRDVVADQANAVESLASVAREWNRISDELGRESQRTAYRRSEGLAD